MMTLAKGTKGRTELAWSDLSGQVAALRDQMMARGRAKLGDKTVVDMIDTIALALAGVSSRDEAAARSVAAARDTLERFRGRPNPLGRARMFGEKTIGLDDPGMLAIVRLLDSGAAEPATH